MKNEDLNQTIKLFIVLVINAGILFWMGYTIKSIIIMLVMIIVLAVPFGLILVYVFILPLSFILERIILWIFEVVDRIKTRNKVTKNGLKVEDKE